MRFGISTHLYHDRRLERAHLAQIAAAGFETIELFATRSHFDYHSESAIADLKAWLHETGLTLNSVHAPITDVFGGKGPRTTYSNAVSAHDRREAAVRETEAALTIARTIPFDVMVLHLGTPASMKNPEDNQRAAALRSLAEICRLSEPFGSGWRSRSSPIGCPTPRRSSRFSTTSSREMALASASTSGTRT